MCRTNQQKITTTLFVVCDDMQSATETHAPNYTRKYITKVQLLLLYARLEGEFRFCMADYLKISCRRTLAKRHSLNGTQKLCAHVRSLYAWLQFNYHLLFFSPTNPNSYVNMIGVSTQLRVFDGLSGLSANMCNTRCQCAFCRTRILH